MGWAFFSAGICFRGLKLFMNFISLACDVILCFGPLCAIFISSAGAVQEFCFHICQPPPAPFKKKIARQ